MEEHSPHFSQVKTYYDDGLWGNFRLKMAVVKNWITKEEYEEITGQEYEQ